MNKLINDINSLTNITTGTLNELVELSEKCICHNIYENLLNKNSTAEYDIGIGILYIKYEDNNIKYKFIPNKEFEEKVVKTVVDMESPVIEMVESTLRQRVESTYKKLI